MMFMFKKILAECMSPASLSLGISLIGLLLLVFTKRQRAGKVFVAIGLFLMLLFGYSFMPNYLLRPLEGKYGSYYLQLSKNSSISEGRHSVKFIVVLGGGHISDPKLPITSQIGEVSLVRLIEGIRIYRKYSGVKLILSGGRGFDPIPTAHVMAHVAKELGVDENDIILESQTKDTKDEAQFIRPLVGNGHFILVTSASHMPRSIALFKKQGMNPIPAPTGHLVIRKQGLSPSSFFPGAGNLRKAEAGFYEYLGIAWAKLRGKI
jgi:uncharacterized SAM-binding protein YcdF (DUF218 family)